MDVLPEMGLAPRALLNRLRKARTVVAGKSPAWREIYRQEVAGQLAKIEAKETIPTDPLPKGTQATDEDDGTVEVLTIPEPQIPPEQAKFSDVQDRKAYQAYVDWANDPDVDLPTRQKRNQRVMQMTINLKKQRR